VTNPATNQTAARAQGRSSFVTALAWTFIVLAGFATFISVLQALMFYFFFPADTFSQINAKELEEMPATLRFMMRHILGFFVLFWSLSAATFVSAIALLRRKNWARLAFIALMALGIVWNLAGLWLQAEMMPPLPGAPAHDPRAQEFQAHFETMMTVMKFATAVFAIAVSALFAWIIKRLASPSVKAEFDAL